MASYTTPTDTELFGLLQRRAAEAEQAFGELYQRHQQWVFAYVLKVVGSVDEAKDIFQETFIRIVRTAPDTKEPVQNVAGLLMRIARNLCLNHLRDRKETVEIEDLHLVADQRGHYERDELLGLISVALDTLDVEYREAFVMRLYHDLPYDEIAEITKTTVPTVKNRVWRAKDRIKHLLAPVLAEFERL